jgi:hypothetical protein
MASLGSRVATSVEKGIEGKEVYCQGVGAHPGNRISWVLHTFLKDRVRSTLVYEGSNDPDFGLPWPKSIPIPKRLRILGFQTNSGSH